MVIVLPLLLESASRITYLVIAESFAPLAGCALFWAAFGNRKDVGRWPMWRDLGTITLANLPSFGLGEVLHQQGWWIA